MSSTPEIFLKLNIIFELKKIFAPQFKTDFETSLLLSSSAFLVHVNGKGDNRFFELNSSAL